MSIFTAAICVALGVALSETYAYIRRRAEKDAYERGYKQAHREDDIRDAAIDEYAVTTPRRLGEYQAALMQQPATFAPGLDPVEMKPPVGRDFMDRLQTNGQATAWLGKEV